MTDESNGESTFEFVEKRMDEITISNPSPKTDFKSNIAKSVLTQSGNLLSNISPPSALPSFIASSSMIKTEIETSAAAAAATVTPNDNESRIDADDPDVQTKQPLSISNQQLISDNSTVNSPDSLAENRESWTSWVKNNLINSDMINMVAKSAKNSVNSMITTLDPQMREYIYSGGDVEVIVASDKEIKVGAVREAFQRVFGKATVTGRTMDTSFIPRQPVGFVAGLNGAEQRIKYLRNALDVSNNIPVVAVQNFLLEVETDKWFELAVVMLDDPKNNVTLQMFTQMVPVPSQVVAVAKESTPENYPLKSLGFAQSVGDLMATNLQVLTNEWHHSLTGVSRREIILLAAQSLAGIYKNTISMV